MNETPQSDPTETETAENDVKRTPLEWIEYGFVKIGVLPPLLFIAVVVFSQLSDNWLFANEVGVEAVGVRG